MKCPAKSSRKKNTTALYQEALSYHARSPWLISDQLEAHWMRLCHTMHRLSLAFIQPARGTLDGKLSFVYKIVIHWHQLEATTRFQLQTWVMWGSSRWTGPSLTWQCTLVQNGPYQAKTILGCVYRNLSSLLQAMGHIRTGWQEGCLGPLISPVLVHLCY